VSMYPTLLIITILFPLAAAFHIWRRTGDPLHLGVVMAPLFAYAYGIHPLVLYLHDFTTVFFPDIEDLNLVQGVYLACIVALFVGLRSFPVRGTTMSMVQRFRTMAYDFRAKVQRMGYILGVIAVSAYVYALITTGGILAVFGRAKGGVHVSSGYLGEAPLLGFLASFLLAIAWARRGLSVQRMLGLIFPLIPFAMQSVLGGRRGPTFMVGMTLLVGMSLVSRKPFTMKRTATAVFLILLAMIFVVSQRKHVYLGSSEGIELSRVAEYLVPVESDQSDDYIVGAGSFLVTLERGDYYWGGRYLVMLLIRPIPRQIWPDKYAFFGFQHIDEAQGAAGDDPAAWVWRLGWIPPPGTAWGLISDLFQEFSWGCIPFCFFLGRFLALLRMKALLRGGMWVLLYLECFPIVIFLPTQSFTAAAYRYMLLAIPGYFLVQRQFK